MKKTLKRFFKFLFRWKWSFLIYGVASLAAAVFGNINPYISKLLIDAIPAKNYQLLLKLVFVLVGARFAANSLSALSYYLGDRVAIPASNYIKELVFTHVQNLDFAYHANKRTGSLISAFKRGDGAFWALFLNMREIFNVLVAFVVGLFFFTQISLWLVLTTIILIVVNFISGYFLIKRNVRRRRELNEVEDEVTGVIADNFLNYETVKYFAGEKKERRRLHKRLKRLIKKAWGYTNTFRMMDITIGTNSILGLLAVLLISLSRLKKGQMTTGDLVMVVSFTTSFYYQSFRLLYQARNIAKNFTDLKRYFSLLDIEPRVKDPENPKDLNKPKAEIKFQNVTFDYPEGKEEALVDFSLRVTPGEVVALVGRSGAGKTTLVKLIFRLYELREGKILIDGVDIKTLKKESLRKIVGIVPQEPILFNDTLGFNIAFAKEGATQKQLEEVVKMANLAEFVKTLPKGFETKVGERGIKLSGGQKQRLAIARMLLEDPKIIIFDEATSQLDSESEMLIQEALWRVARNRTVLIIAHRFSTLRNADTIIVLEDGKLKEKGTHKELIKKEGLYKHLWDLQTKDNVFSDQELSQ